MSKCVRPVRSVAALVILLAAGGGVGAATGGEPWRLAWTRELPQREVAWEHAPNTPSDPHYEMAVAGDLETGGQQWRRDLDVMLPNIAYHEGEDLVLLPSRHAFVYHEGEWKSQAEIDRMKAPEADKRKKFNPKHAPGVLTAVRAADGQVAYRVSEQPYREPYSLVGRRVTQRSGVELDARTGVDLERAHPVTGRPATWTAARGGCTYLVTSRHFAGHRHGWNDLEHGLTGHFGGIDAGCTPSYTVAGGPVNGANLGVVRFRNRSSAVSRTYATARRIAPGRTTAGPPRSSPMAARSSGWGCCPARRATARTTRAAGGCGSIRRAGSRRSAGSGAGVTKATGWASGRCRRTA